MFTAINPATEETFATFPPHDEAEIERRLALAENAFQAWRKLTVAERAVPMRRLAATCRERARALGELAAKEMGKPVLHGAAEAEKCALVCEYYADNAEAMLAPEPIATEAAASFVRFDPIGPVLAVMPWNYPYWQVMRFAAPALMAGNVGLLKHASNVQACAGAFEDLFVAAGFPEGVFQNLRIDVRGVERVLRDKRVHAVALTGSERAGASVGAIAGSEIKKCVLELGGSDPFIVLADADIDAAAETAAKARLQNCGQSCIAAKRFVVVREVAEAFTAKLAEKFREAVIGDPMDEKTTIGPLATANGRNEIASQVERSVAAGAKVVCGGKAPGRKGFFYEPTILTGVKKGMAAYDEETFGPVAAVIVAEDAADAVRIANDTDLGLGSSLWTKDRKLAEKLAAEITAGSVFINAMVKSDPRLPFGGNGKSGYGRELSRYGLLEFVNIKTVWVQ